jgi:hypothetical protein
LNLFFLHTACYTRINYYFWETGPWAAAEHFVLTYVCTKYVIFPVLTKFFIPRLFLNKHVNKRLLYFSLRYKSQHSMRTSSLNRFM